MGKTKQKKSTPKSRRLEIFTAYPQAELPPSAVLSSLRGHACSEPQLERHKLFLASGFGSSLASLQDDLYFQRVPFRKQKVWAQKQSLISKRVSEG